MPAYVISEIDVLDPAGYEAYRQAVPAILTAFGARYLARGGRSEVLEGNGFGGRVVVLEFDSLERAKAWLDSPEYREAREMRHRTARTRMIAVEGVAQEAIEAPAAVPVFFYGLFMDADLLRTKGVEPRGPRRAAVAGWALRIGARATLVPDGEGLVHGIVMGLGQDELARLYAEPGLSVYQPEAVLARLEDGAVLPALCYVLPASHPPTPADAGYVAQLRALAERLGLPPGYVAAIG